MIYAFALPLLGALWSLLVLVALWRIGSKLAELADATRRADR